MRSCAYLLAMLPDQHYRPTLLAPGQLAALGPNLTAPCELGATQSSPAGPPPLPQAQALPAEIELAPRLRLRCLRLLGRGGMGVVYLVEDPQLGRKAALKLVLGGERNERRLQRFQRESAVTARLDHPQIPAVHAAGQTLRGDPYLLMRYVDGASLEERIRQHHSENPQQEPRALLGALVKAAEGVAHAHSRRIVHRDLKPANVMIGAFGEVQVVDWGLARDLAEPLAEDQHLALLLSEERAAHGSDPLPHPDLTQAGALLGTLAYMPPEQCSGRDVDERADVFGLGGILCEVLTNEPTYPDAVIGCVFEGQVTPLEERRRVAPELAAIAARALAASPDERYPSALAFAEDLQAYLEGRPVSAYDYGRWERAQRWLRRHPTLSAALSVALVLGALGIGLTLRAQSQARAEARLRALATARAGAQGAWELAEAIPELVGGSADLTPSNLTKFKGALDFQALKSWIQR